ncbi:MAG: C-GCAxxG-C-C family protein [Actinomycetota bacterium]
MIGKGDIAYERALIYFREGHNCAQSVIMAVSDAEGEEVPLELITGTAGFSGGIGFSGDACGSVSGGVIAMGVFLSRKGVKQEAIPKAGARFLRWFKEEFGVSNCYELREGKSFRSTKGKCGEYTARTARKVVDIIESY